MTEPSPRSRDWLNLVLAVAGPFTLTVFYIIVMELRGDESFASGQGAGAARRDMHVYGLYCLSLVVLIVVGTLRCQRPVTKAVFATLAACASVFFMFIAFFSQMAG